MIKTTTCGAIDMLRFGPRRLPERAKALQERGVG